jgi:creatinine amidohydrolase
MTAYRLEELFPPEIEERLKVCPVVVLPLGTIEWHSLHLPVGLDGLVAHAICGRIANALGAVLAPTSYWAAGGVPYPYTLRLSLQHVEPILEAVLEQFGAMGFRLIVAFTGHFGLDQTLAMKRAASKVMTRSDSIVLPLTEYDLTTDLGYLGDHAGTGETSLLMACSPELVRLDAVSAAARLEGVIGEDPRGKASGQSGEVLLEAIVIRAAQMVRRLLECPHQERALYRDALAAGVRVLEETGRQRSLQGKDQAPPVVTPAYAAYCQAMCLGDYPAALASAARKLSNPAA